LSASNNFQQIVKHKNVLNVAGKCIFNALKAMIAIKKLTNLLILNLTTIPMDD
jgi:hypothetical protein